MLNTNTTNRQALDPLRSGPLAPRREDVVPRPQKRLPGRVRRWLTAPALVAAATAPTIAHAAPGGGAPLVGFAQSVLGFLTGTLGPIIFGIGLAVAAISLVMGSREGLQKAIWAVVGGALLFGVDSVVGFVASHT